MFDYALLDALAAHVQQQHPQWTGFGLAIQAYQLRARATVEAVAVSRSVGASIAPCSTPPARGSGRRGPVSGRRGCRWARARGR